MRWLHGLAFSMIGAWTVAACSSGGQGGSVASEENVGTSVQAITTACGFDTIGLPCDPDGPAGPKLECEGNCGLNTNGVATCQNVAAGTLDGVVCGNGVGALGCKKYCSG